MPIETSIGWADATWNPATGCTRGCPHCYAREMHHRFEKVWGYDFTPMLHEERLKQPYRWRRPRRVFVCSMGELFELDPVDVERVLRVCRENPRHRFLVLTQREEDLGRYSYPGNVWVGVTVTGAVDEHRIWRLVNDTNAAVKYVSFEPLLSNLRLDLDLCGVDWVIVGGRRRVTWPRPLPRFVPPQWWVELIIAEARRVGAAVFLKDNLEWPEAVREWPEAFSQLRLGAAMRRGA